MKNKLLALFLTLSVVITPLLLAGCDDESGYTLRQDQKKNLEVAANLATSQPTPTDINYSIERYNLIRRAYWVNGQREKATTLPCPIADIPLGYAVLLTASGSVVARFEVEGKVSSLNSYLTPESEAYEYNGSGYNNDWIADVDGSYGVNDNGIFFFTPDRRYIEWNGPYLYSDIPFDITDPIIKMNEG